MDSDDKLLTELYTINPVVIDVGDLGYVVETPGTSPASGAFKFSELMFNRYKITPSVSSNNLTLSLKLLDGTDPSTDRPLHFKIGNEIRAVTGPLSVTKNAGTNWFNSGGAELATKETDYFVYIGYNSTDGVVIGFSRIPYAMIYSDFSATSTSELYCAISTITNAASGDDYVVIGRFAATLSAGAGYTWSVPTFTSKNLVQFPIYETRLLDYNPAISGLSGYTTAKYSLKSKKVFAEFTAITKNVTSASPSWNLPFTPGSTLFYATSLYDGSGFVVACIFHTGGARPVTVSKTAAAGVWAGSETGAQIYNIINFDI